jgi:hypothetical protein
VKKLVGRTCDMGYPKYSNQPVLQSG